jgi:hypothetical protein
MNSDNPTLVRVVSGPIMMILLGALLAVGQWTPYGFSRTWPALLIVYGVLKLAERMETVPAPTGPSAPQGDRV